MTPPAALVEAPARRVPRGRPADGLPPAPPTRGGGDEPEGDRSPRRPPLDNVALAMLFLIGAEVMFFAGLVSAFLVLRLAAPLWPPPLQPRLPVAVTALNTLVLLASSLVLVRAGRAWRAGEPAALARGLGWTALLGTTFLVVQGSEWARLVHFGLTLGSGAYGTTFYTLIGAHAAHVLGALLWLGVVLALVRRGPPPEAALRACAIYWHFVVALWPMLYVMVYLL